MGIYTKTGDKGTTSLYTGERIPKYSLQVDAYGTLDECSAQISVAEKFCEDVTSKELLIWIIKKIFLLNAELASSDVEKLTKKSDKVSFRDIEQLENKIDGYIKKVGQVDFFILPGKTLAAAELHLARCMCRRAERKIVELNMQVNLREEILAFMNRLSDLLYILARYEDKYADESKIVNEVMKRYQKEKNIGIGQNNRIEIFFELVECAVSQAKSFGIAVAIHLVDLNGEVIGSFRMENSLLVANEISYKKAYSAVAMRMGTREISKLIQPGSDLYQLETSCDGKIVSFAGGDILQELNGELWGAVGISGGSIKEDELILEKVKECWERIIRGNNK